MHLLYQGQREMATSLQLCTRDRILFEQIYQQCFIFLESTSVTYIVADMYDSLCIRA